MFFGDFCCPDNPFIQIHRDVLSAKTISKCSSSKLYKSKKYLRNHYTTKLIKKNNLKSIAAVLQETFPRD